MIEKVQKYIEERNLLNTSDRLLLAISGGVDSMVMLSIFQHLPYEFSVAHLNFGLRADESDGDEHFVKSYCEEHSIKYHLKKVDTLAYAQLHKKSIQVAAREIRYAWFRELKEMGLYDKLLIAHHSDDSIETTFINIIRGTGIAGLKGVVNTDVATRPMLCSNRKEIIEYAILHGIKWREDSSNAKNDYLRNNLRNTILPMFDEISNTWRENVIQFNKDIEESELILKSYYSNNISKIYNNNTIHIEQVNTIEFGLWMLRKLLISLGFTHDTISDIIQNINIQKGKYFESDTHLLRKNADSFSVELKNVEQEAPEEIILELDTKRLELKNVVLEFDILEKNDSEVKFNPSANFLDFNALHFPLKLRTWQAGDWFIPLGMQGKKKLSDYFVDKKFTIEQKENTYVIVNRENIVCILGHQIDERYKINNNTTKIYHVKLING